MSTNNRPADCVCNLGHCAACLAAGIVCERPGCANVRADGKPCPGLVPPPSSRRAPAMPQPELVEDEPACVDCAKGRAVDCIRNDGHSGECIPRHDPRPTPTVCTTSEGLIAALRASTDGPGARALAHALARPFDADHKPGAWRMPVAEARARASKLLGPSDLDAHERRRYAPGRLAR